MATYCDVPSEMSISSSGHLHLLCGGTIPLRWRQRLVDKNARAELAKAKRKGGG